MNNEVDYTTKDKFVELVLAHRSVREGLKDDLKQCESLFPDDMKWVFERMMNTIHFADSRIISFLERSGKTNELPYLQTIIEKRKGN